MGCSGSTGPRGWFSAAGNLPGHGNDLRQGGNTVHQAGSHGLRTLEGPAVGHVGQYRKQQRADPALILKEVLASGGR